MAKEQPNNNNLQAITLKYAVISAATTISECGFTTLETTTWRVPLEPDHLERDGTPGQGHCMEKTTEETQEAIEGEVALSGPEATTVSATTLSRLQRECCSLLKKTQQKTQLNRGAAKAKIVETQNVTRSEHAVSKGETAVSLDTSCSFSARVCIRATEAETHEWTLTPSVSLQVIILFILFFTHYR